MVYYNFRELLGRNSKDAYIYYTFIIECLRKLSPESWELDNTSELCYNGVNIPLGFWINNFKDAYAFAKLCF